MLGTMREITVTRLKETHETQLALLLTMLTAAAVGSFGSAANASAQSPCGTRDLSSTHYKHVIWIWKENHSYDEIIGSSEAPYSTTLAAECGLATNYHNISHPSLPNYVAATSGLPFEGISQFTSDCDPSPECSTSSQSIFGQTHSWKAYEESMPRSCYPTNRVSTRCDTTRHRILGR